MRWVRFFTQAGRDPLESVRLRSVPDEEGLEYAVPEHWNQAAVDVLLEKVFYPAALPSLTKRIEEAGVPAWLWRSEVDDTRLDGISAEWRYRLEKDIREVLKRIAGALTYRAWNNRLFKDEEDARIFHDELCYILLHQIASPELGQWAKLGLAWAYGLPDVAFIPAARISSFNADTKNALKRIQILSDTLALEISPEKIAVTLPVENIDSPVFIGWKRNSELKRIAEQVGTQTLKAALYQVMEACDRDNSFSGFDPERNLPLYDAVEEAKRAGVAETAIRLAISRAQQGDEEIHFPPPDETGSAEHCIKTVISLSDEFIETALTGHSFPLYEGEELKRRYPADQLWDSVAEAVWSSGEPSVSFRDSIAAASSVGLPLVGEGFVFLSGSTAPAATINLLACAKGKGIVDIQALQQVTRVMIVALDAAAPQEEYRPLLLGMTNIAALLMGKGLAYDSDAGRATAALVAALVSGTAHQVSAEMAAVAGAFPAYPAAAKTYLHCIKNKMAALAGAAFLQKGMTRRPVQMRTALCPDIELLDAAKQIWDDAYRLGKETGFRHAHLTGIATGAEVQALLGAQTRDIMPSAALVRFEESGSARLYGKKLNPMAARALVHLGYTAAEREDMHFYAVGHGNLLDAPCISHKNLRERGFHQAALDAVESALNSALHIRYAFNKWTLGDDFCRRILGFSAEDLESGEFDMLSALGFSEDDIDAANLYCCGALTLEGAPHLKPAHLNIFSTQHVSPEAQIRMQAALEQFLSGGIAHTVILDHYATIDDVRKLIMTGWELGVKSLNLYREGCSLLHPVALPLANPETTEEEESLPCLKQFTAA